MIVVFDDQGEVHEFPDATRFATDEHNNLELWAGSKGEKLICVFRRDIWSRVEVQV